MLTLIPITPVMVAEGDVAIDAANFPDDNFRNYAKTFGTNNDNVLSSEEFLAVTEIAVYDKNIADLRGVERFTDITFIFFILFISSSPSIQDDNGLSGSLNKNQLPCIAPQQSQ